MNEEDDSLRLTVVVVGDVGMEARSGLVQTLGVREADELERARGRVNQQVVRVDVEVDNVARVQLAQRVQQLSHVFGDEAFVEQSCGFLLLLLLLRLLLFRLRVEEDVIEERSTLDRLHDEHERVVGRVIGVMELDERWRLATCRRRRRIAAAQLVQTVRFASHQP